MLQKLFPSTLIIRSQLNHREEGVFTAKFKLIKPLFTTINQAQDMGKIIVTLIDDNYNRKSGAALINAKNDTQAISSFLNEYKDSSETIRSYAKEIERLLLWCMYIGKVNISSIKRDHLL